MKKILVTGGAGFIGSHLCLSLIEEGNRVVCIDNLSSGDIHNIKDLLIEKNFQFIEWDIIESYPFEISFDEIYHLACPASPKAYQEDPIQTFKTAVIGSLNMLELAKKDCAKILLTSTSEVYGDPLKHPQTEDYWGNVNPIGIRSCYDEGKRGAECLFMDYHRQYSLRTKIARIFNTYGSNMAKDDGRVIPNFIKQAFNNQHITIYGTGNQTRSFQYVDDCILGLKLIS